MGDQGFAVTFHLATRAKAIYLARRTGAGGDQGFIVTLYIATRAEANINGVKKNKVRWAVELACSPFTYIVCCRLCAIGGSRCNTLFGAWPCSSLSALAPGLQEPMSGREKCGLCLLSSPGGVARSAGGDHDGAGLRLVSRP